MNSLRLLLVLTAAGALALAGCNPDAKCVADCDTLDVADVTGDPSSGSDESTAEDSTGSNACESAQADAAAFIESHRQCETNADCKSVDGICYQGPEQQCGSVGVSNDADVAQWEALMVPLQDCGCGANACGATVVCTDAGICEAQFGTQEAECAIAEQAVENFLAENRACEFDEDCVLVGKGCYDGLLAPCVDISLNVDANLELWDELQAPLGECGHECGGNDCGSTIRCGEDGLCEAFF